MKKKYIVSWNEVWCCQSEVYAENETEAVNIALDSDPCQKEYGEVEDVNVECDEI